MHALVGAHARSPAEILTQQSVYLEEGLSDGEAAERLARCGTNTVVSRPSASALELLLHQLRSPIFFLLLGAGGLAFFFDEYIETAAIGAVLALNTLIGFLTEHRAVRSIEALRATRQHEARVRRGGKPRLVPVEQLVPGDIALLAEGDEVGADMRLLEAANLSIDESMLTGESVPVDKAASAVPVDTPLAERASMAFKGTAVTRGQALGVVTATGMHTELGAISSLAETAGAQRSPLEVDLARLAGQLIGLTGGLVVIIAAMGWLRGEGLYEMAATAIALAVAAIPEGLPVVATLALARGMWRMARRKALVENLPAVETLGATTVILTDKTGTLTENRMSVGRVWVPGDAFPIELTEQPFDMGLRKRISAIVEVAVLCNTANLSEKGAGDPMELALLRLGERAGFDQDPLRKPAPAAIHPFDSAVRMMATVHARGDAWLYAVKGAPEAVIGRCTAIAGEGTERALTPAQRDQWMERSDQLAQGGMRVLAFARRQATVRCDDPYRDLTFLGLVGLIDPARADVPAAIRACMDAGVRVIMVTGDHPTTARVIGRSVGLGDQTMVAGSAEANGYSTLGTTDIYARATPRDKIVLVRQFQQEGEVVAMTGDGANDGPALRQADIGIAMGRRGTDVARQAADMILLDDAFATIVAAIREGRVIFSNIRRFATYLLSCNLSEILVVGLAVFAGLPLPLLPLQILYLNLVTDVFPAFALAAGEGDGAVMERPPRRRGDSLLGRAQWASVILQGLLMAAATLAAMGLARVGWGLGEPEVVTVTFLTLALAQVWHVLNMRSATSPILFNEVTCNRWVWGAILLCILLLVVPGRVPVLADVLGLAPLSLEVWELVLTMSLAPLAANQVLLALRGWMNRA